MKVNERVGKKGFAPLGVLSFKKGGGSEQKPMKAIHGTGQSSMEKLRGRIKIKSQRKFRVQGVTRNEKRKRRSGRKIASYGGVGRS